MIAGCPTCAARYRIDTAKLRPEGARLRCARCETVFRVRPPEAAAASPAAAPSSPAPAVRAASPTAPQASAPAPVAPAPATSGGHDAAPLVLIAHSEPEAGKRLADAVARWGLRAQLVHDGVEAILNVQRSLPRVVVLDAALPKMFGFQVCELMKRNEQLRGIPVVLVGAIHHRDRYRRAPEELYGADAYAEGHELPAALAPLLARFGIATTAPAPAPAPAAPPAPAPAVQPASEPSPAPAASPGADGDSEVEKGLRLARIIVSDVVLYNAEKFETGVRNGNVVEALSAELEEGYGLFAQRVDTGVCDPREYLERELVRVARSRGMAG